MLSPKDRTDELNSLSGNRSTSFSPRPVAIGVSGTKNPIQSTLLQNVSKHRQGRADAQSDANKESIKESKSKSFSNYNLLIKQAESYVLSTLLTTAEMIHCCRELRGHPLSQSLSSYSRSLGNSIPTSNQPLAALAQETTGSKPTAGTQNDIASSTGQFETIHEGTRLGSDHEEEATLSDGQQSDANQSPPTSDDVQRHIKKRVRFSTSVSKTEWLVRQYIRNMRWEFGGLKL